MKRNSRQLWITGLLCVAWLTACVGSGLEGNKCVGGVELAGRPYAAWKVNDDGIVVEISQYIGKTYLVGDTWLFTGEKDVATFVGENIIFLLFVEVECFTYLLTSSAFAFDVATAITGGIKRVAPSFFNLPITVILKWQ